MVQNNTGDDHHGRQKITVEATSIDGIAAALDMEIVEESEPTKTDSYPDALDAVLATLTDIYRGVVRATDEDSRGRSRKMVREYADREDLDSEAVGHLLRVLEAHDLVIQDGNRWRLAESETE